MTAFFILFVLFIKVFYCQLMEVDITVKKFNICQKKKKKKKAADVILINVHRWEILLEILKRKASYEMKVRC